ncbi:T9SS type A sorting domain-containing protein [Ferruginibacter lapsinanis]|uniref:alpha-amylase family glycosyl hydrolase n=1 Tax=Ferruginibacter lapsinanis TaxID=563172 RepID=UPI001E619281|nr:alpha-amylase family glycosyl hydrolase [Ferruginibacter lapsinanis]UEG50627.1 T9SS type A sorting domain-containing protein [Ferruginibacter lapsinanis]
MKKYVLLCVALFVVTTSFSQLLTWSPQFPTETSSITITVDATKGNQGLLGVTSGVYMHIGVLTNLSTGATPWKYVPASCVWGTTTAPAATAAGTNKWSFTINNPRTFFGVPAGETIQKIAVLFRDGPGAKKQANTDGTDMYIPLYTGANNIRITTPISQPTYNRLLESTPPAIGSSMPVTAEASVSGNLTLSLNGNVFATTTGTTISGNATVAAGNNQIIASLNGVAYDTINFFKSIATVNAPKPATAVEGINYYNCTDSLTLVLYAPNKTSCMLLGDFAGSNWAPQAQYQMYKDGNYFWITLHGLTPGTEYAYQYLVDNTIYVADPYCEKILDPWNDSHINPNSYPNLRPYPSQAAGNTNGYVSVLQICEPQYNWNVTNFSKPDSKQLIVYELLVRDFVKLNPPGSGYDSIGNFQAVIDSINYLKSLGINAVELMPVQEFSGNQSWGYNPTFYFAPDKVYGSKNKLKELIDLLHQNGMAVILDVVYNQEDAYNTPHGKLYWDAVNNRPATNNPWLNPTAPHMFSVFNDFNHSSAATQYFVKRNLEHWLKEYKVDGFRFDLVKGFTQNSGTEGTYDASRVGYMQGYKDYVNNKGYSPYFILEFLGALSEEQDYVNRGMLPWRKMTDPYNENTMGQTGNKNIGNVMWNYNNQVSSPGLVGYMESHDEERLMAKNLLYGASSGPYNVKTLATALERMEAAGAVFFTVPGPKMIWQFGEMGYDYSIGYGGSNVSNKPPRWDYLTNADRKHLYDAWAKMIKFRTDNPSVFTSTPSAYDFGGGYLKTLQIGDATTKVAVVANFGITTQSVTLSFQKTGGWYNLISNNTTGTGSTTAGLNGITGSTFTITNASQTINLAPGEYHIYVSVPPCTSANPTVVTPISYCQNSIAQSLTATGSGLLWYTTPTNGTGVATLTPSTTTAGGTTYYVTQTTGGCSESQRVSLVVNITAAPEQPTASVTTAPTCTTPTGTITVTAPTGANIRYSINGTDYTNTNGVFTGLTPGTSYNITAKDINSTCVSVVRSVAVPAVPGAPATPQVSVTQATCTVATGTVTITSDKTGLTFSSNGVDYTNASGVFTIAAGTAYSITAKNSSGCVSTPVTGTLNAQPITPTAPQVSITEPTCTTATATITVTSDKTGLVFSSNGVDYTNTSGVFANINAGAAYSITAKTINGGCVSPARTGTITAQPNVPGQPTASVTTAPTCIAPTGTITVTAPTGSNIRYSINGTDYTNTNGVFTGLTPGTSYNITAKDINSTCVSVIRSVTVPAVPGAPATPQVSVTQATCTVATGTVTVTSDKTGLTFSSNGVDYTNTNGVFTIAAGAAYSITAKNSAGCVSSPATGTLNAQPVTPAAPLVDVTQPTCTTATATITITSDKTGLVFSSDGTNYTNTSGVFSNILAGSSYSITAKTINGGCVSPARTGTVNVQPNVPTQPTASVTTAPTCIAPTGTITVTAPTGANIRYSINGTDYTNTNGAFTGLTPGTSYNITAKDINSTCVSVVRSVAVPAVPGAPAAPQVSVTQATCTVATGTVTVTSDKTGLTFSSNGVDYTNTSGVFTIAAGTAYSITAKNSSGCVSTPVTGTLNAQPITPTAPQVSITEPTCTTATATITVTSDKTGLVFSSNGVDYTNTSGVFANINAGAAYSITAKTINGGCVSPARTGTITAQPNVPGQPTASVTTAPTCIAPTGTITVTAPTGSNIRYSINGTDYTNTNGVFTGLTPGTSYNITAKDINSTCVSAVRSIVVPVIPGAPATPQVSVTTITCTITTATITVTSDKTGLTFSSNGVDYTNTSGIFTNINAGAAYSITAKNSAGCVSSPATGNVASIPGPPNPPGVISPINYCQNATASALTATGTGLKWYTSPTGQSSTSSIIPSTSLSGSTIYYVSQTTDCGESQRAQIIVNVNETPSAPTGLNTTGITNVAAIVSWSNVVGASSYTVEYKLTSAVNWTALANPVTGLSITISGLTATTSYDWRVRANCDANNGGAYSSAQFTTNSFSINNLRNGLGIMVYQNPVTPASKLAYIVPADGNCSIILYNSFGQKIKVILNQNVLKGQYEISMADLVQQLSHGTYFLKIRQGNLTNFTKFIKP